MSIIIGFHGCDKTVRDKLVNKELSFKKSDNNYNWLGDGMCFWDDDAERALEFAEFKSKLPQIGKEGIKTPAVVGAIIDLGRCLDLVKSGSLKLLKVAHQILVDKTENRHLLPKNKPLKGGEDLILRYLDCAVIETLHNYRVENNLPPFDSVRGVFREGEDLYENAGFKEKNHIQICIRNSECIRGFFIP